jgi:hypothetical protein
MNSLCLLLGSVLVGAVGMAATNSSPVTFNKDVLPILQKNCQGCHRPGEISPMSLLTYTDARPWAKAMKAAVVSRKMPPWFADPSIGHFSNQMTLSESDINTLVSWVDNGAPEGDAREKPAPLSFTTGWNIRPDLVVQMPKPFIVPAKGAINYKFILVKTNFPEDMWVTGAEMRAGNSKVLHHGEVWVRPPGSHWMENAIPGEAYDNETNLDIMGKKTGEDGELDSEILGKFNPGLGAQSFTVEGGAKFVPKGSDLVFEAHYTAYGTETQDVSTVALTLAKAPPTRRYYYTTGPMAQNLVIPAGNSNAEVVAEVTVNKDNVRLVYLQPHLHVRGKDLELRAIYPGGEAQTLLRIKWDFNWQPGYELKEPIPLPKGTRLIDIVHFDNSPNNPFNPDPSREVLWGPQTWDEMTNVFLGVTIDPARGYRKHVRQVRAKPAEARDRCSWSDHGCSELSQRGPLNRPYCIGADLS